MLRKKLTEKKRIQKYLFGMLLLTLFLNVCGLYAATKAPVYTEKDNTFTGTVTPILSALVRYGYNDTDRGIITYSTRPGQFVYGPIFDSKGKVIKKGDLLIRLKSDYHMQEVGAAIANVDQAKAQLTYTSKNYKRAIQLGKNTNVISKQNYDLYTSKYFEAQQDLKAAQESLITAQSLYDLIQLRTDFDGLVTKVYMAGALLNNEPPVIQLASINPMGIKIVLDHSIAQKLNNIDNTIKVYPVRGDKKETGILLNMTKLTKDGIMLAVENYLISPTSAKPNTPIVNNPQPVLNLYTSENISKPLAVPSISIVQDKGSKESYVWQLVGSKDVQAGKGLADTYTAKKVAVQPGQLIKRINNNIDYIALDNAGNLSLYDLVLINDNLPKGLKDNVEVCLAPNQYLFMPGDQVKIEVNQ